MDEESASQTTARLMHTWITSGLHVTGRPGIEKTASKGAVAH
jgi:hypothetical protein